MVPTLTVVTGLPAAGKTHLGSRLAVALGGPFVTKDEYKEILHEALPDLTRAQAGPLSFTLMYHVAGVALRAGTSCVLETHFYLGVSEPMILALTQEHAATLLQVHCTAPLELLRERHAARVEAGEHPHIHKADLWAQLSPQACVRPLDLGAPLLTLDTSSGVEVPEVASWVRAASAAG